MRLGDNVSQRVGRSEHARRPTIEIIRRVSPYVRARIIHLVLALVCALGYTLFGLLEPWPIKLVFDQVLLERPLEPMLSFLEPVTGNSLLFLNLLVVAILVLVLVRGVMYYYQQVLVSMIGQRAATDIRLDLYRHLQSLGFSFHDRRETGDLLVRLTNDVRLLREFLIAMPLLIVGDLLLMVAMAVVMVLMDWQLAVLALTLVPVLWLLIRTYQTPMRKAIRKQRMREGHLATMASQALGAIKVVQGFRREQYETDRFSAKNMGSLHSGLRATRLEARFRWASEMAIACVTAVILGVGARRVMAGTLSPGDLLVFVFYLRAFSGPLRRISVTVGRVARSEAAAERILETLDTQPAVVDSPDAKPAPRLSGEVFFDRVSFAYRPGGPMALADVTLRIQPHERVALVGPTGSGKTSLVHLIPRFYDPTGGRVCMDGCDVRSFTIASLRERVGLVFQEPVLFATTIRENIAYGKPDATSEEIERAATLAGIHPFVAGLPEGYDTVVGERGGTLSGGQRQCVAIARAIIADAPIVILDEPTAGLDARSAVEVMEALDQLMRGRMVIVISHQVRLIQHVDRVIVLDGGRVVEEGTPADLGSRDGLYRVLQRAQMKVSAP